MFRNVVSVNADGSEAKLLNGGHYSDKRFEFSVSQVDRPIPYSKGVLVPMDVTFTRMPEGTKVMTIDDGWVTPAPDVPVRMNLPIEIGMK